MNSFHHFISLGLLSSLILLSGCKCDDPTNPECDNYDPCYGIEAVDADFELWDAVAGSLDPRFMIKVSTGIITTDRSLIMKSKDTTLAESYWQVGLDPRIIPGNSWRIYFPFPESQIAIRHFVADSSTIDCHPQTGGVDTMIKHISVKTFHDSLPIYGYFRGYTDNKPDELYTIRIAYLDTLGHEQGYTFNFPNGCKDILPTSISASGVFISGTGNFFNCQGVSSGVGQLSTDGDSLSIRYWAYNPDSLQKRINTVPFTLDGLKEDTLYFYGVKQP